MINFFKNLLNWIKAIILWLLIKENREIGIKYTKKALDIAALVSKLTPTTKDDKAVAFLAKQFNKAAILNGITEQSEVEKVAKTITSISNGSLKDVNLGLKEGKINASVGSIGVEYDPSNGGVKFGLSKLLK